MNLCANTIALNSYMDKQENADKALQYWWERHNIDEKLDRAMELHYAIEALNNISLEVKKNEVEQLVLDFSNEIEELLNVDTDYDDGRESYDFEDAFKDEIISRGLGGY